MGARGVVLPLVSVVFGDWSGWRDPVAEWCAPPSSEMSTLGGKVLQGFGVGCGLVDSRGVETSYDVAVASMGPGRRTYVSTP
jgi:hypothetical protein